MSENASAEPGVPAATWILWVLFAALAGILNAAAAITTLRVGVGQTAPVTSLNTSVLLVAPILAVGQWALLRRVVSGTGWWAPLTLVATIPALVAAFVLLAMTSIGAVDAPGWLPTSIALGVGWAPVGFAQWLVLRRSVDRAVTWILATIVAGAASGVAASAVGGNHAGSVPALLLVGLAGGAAYGIVTALVLAALLTQRPTAVAEKRAV